MSANDAFEKVTFTIPPDLRRSFNDAVPEGLRTKIIRSLMRRIIAGVDAHGMLMIAALLSDEYEIVPVMEKKDAKKA